MLGGAIILVIVWAILGYLQDKRAPNLLLANSNLCLDCQYDLSGLTPRGQCPECGQSYDLTKRRR